MRRRELVEGDKVALSATFLRSIDASAAKGWPSRHDRGRGVLVSLKFGWLASVEFPSGPQWEGNVANLVHEAELYREAMHAEHRARRFI